MLFALLLQTANGSCLAAPPPIEEQIRTSTYGFQARVVSITPPLAADRDPLFRVELAIEKVFKGDVPAVVHARKRGGLHPDGTFVHISTEPATRIGQTVILATDTLQPRLSACGGLVALDDAKTPAGLEPIRTYPSSP